MMAEFSKKFQTIFGRPLDGFESEILSEKDFVDFILRKLFSDFLSGGAPSSAELFVLASYLNECRFKRMALGLSS